jgi:hypothetical protein
MEDLRAAPAVPVTVPAGQAAYTALDIPANVAGLFPCGRGARRLATLGPARADPFLHAPTPWPQRIRHVIH